MSQDLLSLLQSRELLGLGGPRAQSINKRIRESRKDNLQPLSTFFPKIGSIQVTLFLGFDELGDFCAAVGETEVKLFSLRLSRDKVEVDRLSRSLHMSSCVDYRLSESRIALITHTHICSHPSFLVVSFAPLDQEDDWDVAIDGHDGIRFGTAALFCGRGEEEVHCEPLLTLRSSSLSTVHSHHRLFRLEAKDMCFLNNGNEVVFWLHNFAAGVPQSAEAAEAAEGAMKLPDELTHVTSTISQPTGKDGHFFFPFVPPPAESAFSVARFRADNLSSLLIEKTYPGKSVDLADLEVRVLGPSEHQNGRFVLIVLALSVLYSGGGRDLGTLVALDTLCANAYPIKWLDLRKDSVVAKMAQRIYDGDREGDRDGDDDHQSTHKRSWLSCAADAWITLLTRKDPRLRRLNTELQVISNQDMERYGTLFAVKHPTVNVTVIHDDPTL